MPSIKKRINLTVPDEIYQKLQAFKEQNGISNDAGACLQLIVLQLRSQENSQLIMKMLQEAPLERLIQLSNEGVTDMKKLCDTAGSSDASVPTNPAK